MRWLLAFSLMIAACGTTEPPTYATLSGTSIGPVQFGMTPGDVDALGLSTHRDQAYLEGDPYDRMMVTVDEGNTVEVIFLRNRVVDITTTSTQFTAHNGARVGNTLRELRQLYLQGRVYIGEEEGRHFTFQTGEGGYFDLSMEGVPASCFQHRGVCPDLGGQRSIRYRIRDLSD